MQEEARTVTGHTALISDEQLTWIQEYTMHGTVDTMESNREARRVLIRAIHVANLLAHGRYTRLSELGSGGYAMSEYYPFVSENEISGDALGTSVLVKMRVLEQYPHGNRLARGEVVPRQVTWARLVVGRYKELRGEGRWRGPMAIALFTVARENKEV